MIATADKPTIPYVTLITPRRQFLLIHLIVLYCEKPHMVVASSQEKELGGGAASAVSRFHITSFA